MESMTTVLETGSTETSIMESVWLGVLLPLLSIPISRKVSRCWPVHAGRGVATGAWVAAAAGVAPPRAVWPELPPSLPPGSSPLTAPERRQPERASTATIAASRAPNTQPRGAGRRAGPAGSVDRTKSGLVIFRASGRSSFSHGRRARHQRVKIIRRAARACRHRSSLELGRGLLAPDKDGTISRLGIRSRLIGLITTVCLAAGCSSASTPAGQAQTPVPALAATSVPATPAATPATAEPAASGTLTTTAGYDWFQFGGDPQHSGDNTQEQALTAANVSGLQPIFHVTLPNVADGTPVFLHAVNTAGGLADLLFVTTKAGDVLALDAHTGATVWSHPAPANTCHINNLLFPCYTTSSPAIDPDRQSVYSYGLDGRVHKYRATDGQETLDASWPEVVTLKPYDEKGSSALAAATARDGTRYLYVATSGYFGDQGDYQGHLVTINLVDGSQHVFNALCSDQALHLADRRTGSSPDCGQLQAGIWARAGAVYDPATDRIYLATGNGTFDPASHHWGDTVFALRPDGTGANGSPVDSYTPGSFARLQFFDVDLGSTAPAVLPPLAGSPLPHLGVQGGKDATLRLINLDDLSGQGGPGHTGGEVSSLPVPMGGQVLTAPATWTDPADGSPWLFVADGKGTAGLQLAMDSATGKPRLNPVWQNASGGTSPLVANGVLYVASSGHVWALAPKTGQVLWSSTQVGGIHWESPIVAGDTLYLTDESSGLTAFSLRP